MGLALEDASAPKSEIDLGPLAWSEYLEFLHAFGLPRGLLGGADPDAFHVLGARVAGENVAPAIAFDLDGDCGIYSMSTLEAARHRGLGTALTTRQLDDALSRGCTTASLQSTEMAEGLYASVGFRDLGRFLEYVP